MSFLQAIYMEDLRPEWMKLPLWRWQRACRFMADPTDDEYEFISDSYLREAASLMHSRARGEPGAEIQMLGNPALVNAHQIYMHTVHHGGARWQVEALILGGADDEKLNEMLPTKGGPRTYRYYRKLFFDVDAYLGNQHAVLANLFGMTMTRHDSYSDHDLPWKMLAHAMGWEKFSEFLNHYVGGRGSREMKQFLQEFQEIRMMYYMYAQMLDMRTAFQDKSLAMFQTSLQHYKIPEETANSILTAGALDSCKGLLTAINRQWEQSQPRQNYSAVELVHSSGQTPQLASADVEALGKIYDADAVVVS